MNRKGLIKFIQFIFIFLFISETAFSQRWMENLGRGVVAFRTTNTQSFISWRMLGTEPSGISFNLYRKTGNVSVKLNSTPITGGTNWQDNTADFSKDNEYFVTAIINGVEQIPSASGIVKANTVVQTYPYISVPLKQITETATDYVVNFVWVGDLDGDGEYDFVVDRIPTIVGLSPKIEAYKRDGTFLWRMDTGPLGVDRNNIEGGASTISNGHWDGLTVYDLDNNGKAEIIVKTAKNFVFGNGSKMSASDETSQFVVVCNGLTGAPLANIKMPTDYLEDGPLQTHFGIAYLDGKNPSVIVKAKNRHETDYFNHMMMAYDFKSGSLTQKWKFLRGSTGADFHQIRTIDVDQDGKDDICDGSYVIDENGKMLYNISIANHGDRFHISDMDPDRPGLEGFAIQQDNPTKLGTYYYDAKNGTVLKSYYTPEVQDMARGNAGDYDADHKGFEFWSFNGMYTAQATSTELSGGEVPWPNFRVWWDGDVLSELLNETKVDKWKGGRLLTAYKMGATEAERGAPMFYGDILGDWREEIIWENGNRMELQIFSTPFPSSVRLYTLPHNPAYRNCFTYKGYMQSNHVDYYLGTGMATPPAPGIVLVGSDKCTAVIQTSGPTTICGSQSVLLTSTLGSAYQWMKDDAEIKGASTQVYTATSTGNYSVKVTNSAGCSATSAATVVTINTPVKWYADVDGDGKGDPAVSQTACTQPVGYVTDNSDLCPADAGKAIPGNCGCGKTELSCLDCNNVVNGKAVTDSCGRCIGGETGKEPCFAAGEAESEACLFDGILESSNTGFKGSGYINVPNVSGAKISFNIHASSEGKYNISFRYANGSATDRPAIISVNGIASSSEMSFSSTTAFTVYKAADVSLFLNEGNNQIDLVASSSGGLANIDQIGYVSKGIGKGSCIVTGITGHKGEQVLLLYPNPGTSSFNLKLSEASDVEILTSEGKTLKVFRSVSELEFGDDLLPGVYLAKVRNKVYKFVKY